MKTIIHNPAEYVEQISQIIDLPLNPEQVPGVVKNFATIASIASLVMEFPLPEDIEPVPIFEP